MTVREMKASEFKARCLQLLDEVAETGEAIIVTKRGKPLAKLVSTTAPTKKQGLKFGFMPELGPPVDPNDDLFSAWDDEMEAAFEDGLQRTADLINPDKPKPTRRRR